MQRQPIRPLILALAVAMAPLVFQLPVWAMGWCALSWGYLLVRDQRGWPSASRGVLMIIFIVGILVLLLSAGLRFDGNDFIALLAVMAGIKPLEIQSRRDSMVTVFLAYFLVITCLFVFENLSMTLYLFASVWVTTGVLIHVNDPKGELRRQLRLAARLIFAAIPLMVMLFILFPRVSGSYWGSPWGGQSRSGFSSVMRIGDVSRLVLVDETAFSVSFDANVPKMDQLYWRGIVFEHFDGRAWHPARYQSPRREISKASDLSRYTVMLEPHGQRHLFALDLPVIADPVATILDDHTLVAHRPIQRRFHYRVASRLDDPQDIAVSPGDVYLQLPPSRNPRAKALGAQWARERVAPEAVVAAALAFFRENDFAYTLRPDRLGVDVVDDFLFLSRNGFCEHYASAFTVLMRAAGVPTRMVGGYQGGRWNALGEFLTVRHSDAHVWCEVWLVEKGWTRVDPTFSVAPNRIDSGIERALATADLPSFLSSDSGNLLSRWTENFHATWEAVNTRWNLWFMGFSAENQIALLKRLGISMGRRGGWLLLIGMVPLSLAVMLLLSRRRSNARTHASLDEAHIIYGRFLKKMARINLPKAPHQGPLDYARSVKQHHPLLKPDVDEIAGRYISLRYAGDNRVTALDEFRRCVRRLKPHRTSAAKGK